MYGITFKSGTSNDLICGYAIFNVSRRDRGRDEQYKLFMHPDSWELHLRDYSEEDKEKQWKTVVKGNSDVVRAELLKRLPQDTSDGFGLDWDWGKFLLALTFFGEGHEVGYKACDHERN